MCHLLSLHIMCTLVYIIYTERNCIEVAPQTSPSLVPCSGRTKRAWRPNIQRKTYRSDILGEAMNIRVTTHAMRCIDRAGGFDAYILHTPDKKLGSALGSELKERMQKTLSDNPQLTPPPKARRIQRQPKRWTLGRPPHKQNIFRLNLEHLLPARMRVGEVANGGGADGTPV